MFVTLKILNLDKIIQFSRKYLMKITRTFKDNLTFIKIFVYWDLIFI